MALETIYVCVCVGGVCKRRQQLEQHEEQQHHLCTPAIEHLAMNNKERALLCLSSCRARARAREAEAAVAAATDK